MADILENWINDANAYELLNTYRIEQQELYPFVNKSEDFYISLLNRMFFIKFHQLNYIFAFLIHKVMGFHRPHAPLRYTCQQLDPQEP